MTSPSDLVALAARLQNTHGELWPDSKREVIAAIEQLQAELATAEAARDIDAHALSGLHAKAEKADFEVAMVRIAVDALKAERDTLQVKLKNYEPINTYDGRDIDSWRTEAESLRAELAAVKQDAERYRWLTSEPEGARHLLSLLQREGSKSIGTFGTMIDRIRASKDAARAQGEGEK